MNKTYIRAMSAAACAALLAACTTGNVLSVKDLNNPDVARAYATPAGIESLIGGLYQQFNNGWNTTNVEAAADAISSQTYSTVANFCMNTRDAVPAAPIINDRGNSCDGGNLADFSNFQKLARNSSNLILALDAVTAVGGTTGTAAGDARDRGFALFVDGIAMGQTALVYDSGAVITPGVTATTIPPLSGSQALMTAALAQIDSAITWAGGTSAAAAFPLPSTWLNSVTGTTNPMTQVQFVQFMHSWKARLRAGVARTPAERAAVDWTSVIADAQAGITSDIYITMGGGWKCSYDCSQMYSSNGWHEMSPLMVGMADTSGAYTTFIRAPFPTRDGSVMLIQTPDLRLPQGANRGLQNNDTPYSGSSFKAGRYINNRNSADDFAGAGYGSSMYDHKRWLSIFKGSGVGPMVQFSLGENNMLIAEGDIYKSNFAGAKILIDASRALHGLPSIGAIVDGTTPVQANANGCVPRVPNASDNDTQCGTILEAMKWEKRMETAYTSFAPWWIDGRGWGDLIQGSPLQWPVPNEEMDSRVEPFYNLGGVGGASSAAKGTYGFPN
jgi:hypothetical protein